MMHRAIGVVRQLQDRRRAGAAQGLIVAPQNDRLVDLKFSRRQNHFAAAGGQGVQGLLDFSVRHAGGQSDHGRFGGEDLRGGQTQRPGKPTSISQRLFAATAASDVIEVRFHNNESLRPFSVSKLISSNFKIRPPNISFFQIIFARLMAVFRRDAGRSIVSGFPNRRTAMLRAKFMPTQINPAARRPPNPASPCPPNGNRTPPPGSAGRTTPATGRANSRSSRGFMARWPEKFPPAKTSASSSGTRKMSSLHAMSSITSAWTCGKFNSSFTPPIAAGRATPGRFL